MEVEKLKISENKKLGASFFESKRLFKFRNLYNEENDTTIVMIDLNRATVYEANEFQEHIENLIENGYTKLILDMESVYFVDSVFFGSLIRLLKQIDKANGYLKLIVDFNSKPKLLSISSFEGIFEIYPNLFEAINSLKVS